MGYNTHAAIVNRDSSGKFNSITKLRDMTPIKMLITLAAYEFIKFLIKIVIKSFFKVERDQSKKNNRKSFKEKLEEKVKESETLDN